MFHGSGCVEGARLESGEARETAHCDVVYPSPNTECNTVIVVKTFFLNGYYYDYDYYYYDDYYKAILAS